MYGGGVASSHGTSNMGKLRNAAAYLDISDVLKTTKAGKSGEIVTTGFVEWHSYVLALELWLSKLSVSFANYTYKPYPKAQWRQNVP